MQPAGDRELSCCNTFQFALEHKVIHLIWNWIWLLQVLFHTHCKNKILYGLRQPIKLLSRRMLQFLKLYGKKLVDTVCKICKIVPLSAFTFKVCTNSSYDHKKCQETIDLSIKKVQNYLLISDWLIRVEECSETSCRQRNC